MYSTIRVALSLLVSTLILSSIAEAQCPADGYGPPPDPPPVVKPDPAPPAPSPPAPATPSPTSPTPAQPATPSPASPTPQPASPGSPPPSAGQPAPGSPPPMKPYTPRLTLPSVAADATGWQHWWRHNRDPFLVRGLAQAEAPRTRGAGEGADEFSLAHRGLSHEDVFVTVLPEILRTLEDEDDWRMVRQAMLAAARIGDDPRSEDEAAIASAIIPFLSEGRTALSEAAVTALGLLANQASVVALAGLALDDEEGRKLVDRHRVPVRTRAIASYCLGLAGARAERPETRRFAEYTLAHVLRGDGQEYPDVQVACVLGLGLQTEPWPADEAAVEAAEDLIEDLITLFEARKAPRMLRTFVPTALARLASSASPESRTRVIELLIQGTKTHTKWKSPTCRSAIAALGVLVDADEDAVDVKGRKALERVAKGRDAIGRSFALVSLARAAARPGDGKGDAVAGTEPTIRFLMQQLTRGRHLQKPWAGVALGILGFEMRAQGREVPRKTRDALLFALGDTRAPGESVAYSIGAGLIGDARASERIQENMERIHDPELRSRAAVALGMVGDTESVKALSAMMDESFHEPVLMEEAALARALSGDNSLVSELLSRLDDADCGVSTQGVTRALGRVGDRRALAPLLAILHDEDISNDRKAYVVEALGFLADKDSDPWAMDLAPGLNYVDAPPTLTHAAGFGILDVR